MDLRSLCLIPFIITAFIGCSEKPSKAAVVPNIDVPVNIFETTHQHPEEEYSIDFEFPVRGHNLVAVKLSTEPKSSGFGSGKSSRHEINFGIFSTDTMTTQWVFPKNDQDVINVFSIPYESGRKYEKYSDYKNEKPVKGHIILMRDKDINADGKLDKDDPYQVIVTEADGQNPRAVLPGLVSRFTYSQLQGDTAFIGFTDEAGPKTAKFNSDTLVIEDISVANFPAFEGESISQP